MKIGLIFFDADFKRQLPLRHPMRIRLYMVPEI